MAIKTLQPEQQELIVRVLEDAVGAVEKSASLDPSQALAESMLAHKLPHRFIQYAVNAFNNGQSVTNIKMGSSREAKAATVPLARCEDVKKHLYGEAEEQHKAASTVVSKDYDLSPSRLFAPKPKLMKSASLHRPVRKAPEPELSDTEAFGKLIVIGENLKNANANLRMKMSNYKSAQTRLQVYFDSINHMRLSDVKEQSEFAFGPLAGVVLDPLHDDNEGHKKASFAHLVRKSIPPMSYVSDAINLLGEVEKAAKEFAILEAQVKEIAKTAELADENDWVSNRVRGYLVPILHKCTFHEPELKSADAAGGNAGPSNFLNLGDLAINEAKSFPGDFKAQIAPVQSKAPSINIQGPAKTDAKKMPSILDPDAENEMHSLALTSPLNNLLASDSSFSAYPKNKIIHAYNEILSAYPRVASNPVTLRPALQRHLAAGGLDEFSLNNLVSQEEKQTNINRSPNVQPPVV
jgi:hypothetical protein